MTKNQIIHSENEPYDFVLATVDCGSDDSHPVHCLRQPVQRERELGVTSMNCHLADSVERTETPR